MIQLNQFCPKLRGILLVVELRLNGQMGNSTVQGHRVRFDPYSTVTTSQVIY